MLFHRQPFPVAGSREAAAGSLGIAGRDFDLIAILDLPLCVSPQPVPAGQILAVEERPSLGLLHRLRGLADSNPRRVADDLAVMLVAG